MRMQKKWYGGNQVFNIAQIKQCETKSTFADGSYEYFIVSLSANEQFSIDHLKSYTIFFLKADHHAKLYFQHDKHYLNPGDSMQIENSFLEISVKQGYAEVLVAGVKQSHHDETNFRITRAGDHYKVSKPWGHELWINGEHPDYSLKEVYIKQGNRTSLQYHRFKEETNVLVKGSARLIYKNADHVDNDKITKENLSFVELSASSILHIVPKVLHRLEAITDILLYETSTAHLDDVIRVSDDHARENGRIAKEHNA